MRKVFFSLFASVCFLCMQNANAQIYMSLDGVDGESTFSAFKNSTLVSSFSWGAKNTTSISTTSTGLTAGKSSIDEFSFTKNRGIGSAAIQSSLYMGKRIPKAEIRYYTSGSTTPYLTVILEDVFITSWKISGAEGERPTESITMTAVRYKTEETVRNPDGSTKRIVTGWDVSKNMPVSW
jgi:type VI secretion system secreted protein Hcp